MNPRCVVAVPCHMNEKTAFDASQYRVQYHRASDGNWILYGCYRDLSQAERMMEALTKRGYEAQVVGYRF